MTENNPKAGSVCIVSNYYPPHIGGLEVVVQKQSESLVTNGYVVSVVTFHPEGTKSSFNIESGIEVYRVRGFDFFDRHFGIPFVIGGVGLWRRLWKEISKCDVVHIHDAVYPISWLGYAIAKLQKKSFVLTQHVAQVYHPAFPVMLLQRIIYKTFGKIIFNNSSAIVVYNQNVKTFLLSYSIDAAKIIEMRNGINISAFRPGSTDEKNKLRQRYGLPLSKPIILFVGRLVSKKRF